MYFHSCMAFHGRPWNGLQKAYGGNMDLSKAWLKDTEKALATLQALALEVGRTSFP